jgi:hypothetical protein
MPHEVTRPNCEQAHAFQAATCLDPGCGLHLIAYRANNKPICEIVLGREAIHGLLRLIHEQGLDL